MNCRMILFGFVFIVATAALWWSPSIENTVAHEPDPCGGKEICRDLLEKGQQAYAKGRYQEAGRFFNRAVNINPVSISMVWYQIQIEKRNVVAGSLETTDPIMPRQQNEKRPIEKPPPEDVQVIMGDDEGC